MTSCDRFEKDGLDLLLSGERLDAHFDGCPECEKAREEYERLGHDLAMLHSEVQPPDGWQTAVWRRIREDEALQPTEPVMLRRPIHRFVRFAVPATLAAGLAGWLVLVPGRLSEGPSLRLVEKHSEAQTFRSGGLRPGDALEIRGDAADRPQAVLRVYDEFDRVYVDCATPTSCTVDGDVIVADLELERRGSYRAVLILSEQPIPPTTGDIDGDIEAAVAIGAEILTETFTVE